jgi:exosortase A-associated hydrolase 1
MNEQPVVFECAGETLVGIVSVPRGSPKLGVVILVGGPQYRVGSHRQFVLLARRLAAGGAAVMRFDYRGMGDSAGASVPFDEIAPDVACAIDALAVACPSIDRVVLCGLCDAASAALLYAHSTRDARIAGLVLLNPWVGSERARAAAYVKHYYTKRMLEASFWRKLLAGGVDIRSAAAHLSRSIRRVLGSAGEPAGRGGESLADRLGRALDGLTTPTLLLLSSDDLTAREFGEYNRARRRGARLTACVEQHTVDADHTFASSAARRRMEDLTAEWLHRTYPEPECLIASGGLLNID